MTPDPGNKFSCVCSKEFSQAAGLLRHKKTCDLVNNSVNQPSYKCSKCSKTFKRTDNQDAHELKCKGKIKSSSYVLTKIVAKNFPPLTS